MRKANGKTGARGRRTVHRLDIQGKAFFCQKMQAKQKQKPLRVSNMAQGFLAHRRREAAVQTQLSSLWRLRRTKRSGALLNLDMANAFGSTSWPTLHEQTDKLFLQEDEKFVPQRFEWATVEIQTDSGPILLRIKTGALQ